jgi:hypothetical protein
MTLKAQHHSVLRHKTLPRPYKMAKIDMAPDARMFIEQEALDIFTVMANSGATFQQSLAAIFLSGMSAAHNARS